MRRLLFRLLAAAPPLGDHVPDSELLSRFVTSNDSAALELIVRRHADAVWAACRRMLNCDANAEDAFQATFLALIRKAKQIRTSCVGGWLHRVAVNASLKLRERAERVSCAEPDQLASVPASEPTEPDPELTSAVHEELAKLPERYRLPVVLCDLEGMSHTEAAVALGWPVGTVSGRLSRAREKLRDRLTRRGLAPSTAMIPALSPPPHLVPNALSLTAGASPAVVSLAEGALTMMTTSAHWTWAAVAVLCAGLVGAGAAVGLSQPGTKPMPLPPGAPPPPPVADNPAPPDKGKLTDDDWIPKPGSAKNTEGYKVKDGTDPPPSAFPDLAIPEPDPKDPERAEKYQAAFAKLCPRLHGTLAIKIEPTDDALRKLLKARLHQGVLQMIRIREIIRIGNWDARGWSEMIECLNDMQAVAVELWGNQPKELIPWLEELVVMAKEIERFTLIRIRLGSDPPQRLNAATRHRLAVETALLKAKMRA
ncbi:MAG: sigma-70 family RNA polymerase sigma factor [Planctomycetia bacterium]|nr:sigma-70 family RNA polymerase sigma factor [Planctomycetia bacterium]